MKLIAILAIALSSTFAHAFEDYGIEVGFRSQNFDHSVAAYNEKSEIGYQLGVTATQEISAPWVIKTGLMYVQRPLKFETSTGGDYRLKLSYFDIPVLFGYKFEYVTAYVGPSLSIKLSSDQDGSLASTLAKPNSVEGFMMPITLGAAFRFAPQIGGNVFFEAGTGDVATNFGVLRAVGANLVVYFD